MSGYYWLNQNRKPMKTLSVRQPWASLLCAGVKDVENRSWAPSPEMIGKKILIHAGIAPVAKSFYDRIPFEWDSAIVNAIRYGWIKNVEESPLGCIIGYATLVGFADSTDSLWDGRDGQMKWIFSDPYVFDDPIPCKGRLGLFEYPLHEDNLPPAHKAIAFKPHLEGTEAVFPLSDYLMDALDEVPGPYFDVTMENVNDFFDPSVEDAYVPREIKTIRLVSPSRTVVREVESVESFPDTFTDTGDPIFYTSLDGEDFVKLMMCFILKGGWV